MYSIFLGLPAGRAYDAPQTPISREGLLAFSNCRFAPSAPWTETPYMFLAHRPFIIDSHFRAWMCSGEFSLGHALTYFMDDSLGAPRGWRRLQGVSLQTVNATSGKTCHQSSVHVIGLLVIFLRSVRLNIKRRYYNLLHDISLLILM